MSFREKSAWACLLTTVAVFVPYFAHVSRLYAHGELRPGPIVSAFLAAVVASMVLNVVAHIAMSILTRQEPRDERDVAIESRSFRIAYYLLGSASILAVGFGLVFGVAPAAAGRGPSDAPIVLSQVLLLCFVAAEVVRYVTAVVSYRRGS